MVRKTKEEAERTRQEILQAACNVFHEHGVSNSSLGQIATAAGVTRGAVYWHFKDKAELFYALHREIFEPLTVQGDIWLLDEDLDPLEALESSIQAFFQTVVAQPTVWKMFEIMVLRCEYVKEFEPVRQAVNQPAIEFLRKLKGVYQRAAERGQLKDRLEPEDLAFDTWVFALGLLNQLLLIRNCDALRQRIPHMISAHIALRRR